MGAALVSATYFDQCATQYLARSQGPLWGWFRRREFQTLLQMIQPQRGQTLLDLGCGAGFYALPMAHQYGLRVTGVDSSLKMLQTLTSQGIQTVHQSVENSVELGTFDQVLAAGVLEFVPHPDLVFANARASMKPGSQLTLLVPTAGIVGQLYKWQHALSGCPTFIRSVEHYLGLGKKFGLIAVDIKKCTPISIAILFGLTNLGSDK